VCAVGRVGKAIALISPEDHFVRLEYCRQAPIKLPPGNYAGYNSNVFFGASPDDGPLMPCFSLPWEGEIAAIDGAGSLFRFWRLKGEPKVIGSTPVSGTVHLIATDVLAVNIRGSRLIYVGRQLPDDHFHIVSVGEKTSRSTPLGEKALRAFFGPPSGLAHPEFGLIALEQTDTEWLVITAKGQKDLEKPDGARVFGVFADERIATEPGLLSLEDDLRTVTMSGNDWRKELLQAHAPVQHIAFCQRVPYIAYSTVNGEIVIYSVNHRADLCRYAVEGDGK
jgi:hypothetical protein